MSSQKNDAVSAIPKPALLISYKEQRLAWKTVLAELIDNSFDAGAKQVRIVFGKGKKRTVEVHDDGNGCPDIPSMLTLGNHRHQSTTKLGRFGIGLKDATCWMWGELIVRSVANGVKRICNVNWASFVKGDKWEFERPIETEPNAGEIGTSIIVKNPQKGEPKDFGRLIDELAFTFFPGLRHMNLQIIFQYKGKRIQVRAPDQPPLDDELKDEFSIDGKSVALKAGIVKAGHPNKHPGFSYTYHHRVIQQSSHGAGPYSTARIYGEVRLDDSWRFSKNKESVSDDLFDKLGEAIFVRCEAILKKADRQDMDLVSAEFMNDLSEKVSAALRGSEGDGQDGALNAKGSRKPGGSKSGTAKATGDGTKHGNARTKQPGARMPGMPGLSRKGLVKIQWQEFDYATLGEVDLLGNRINLNKNNAYLTQCKASKDMRALIGICTGMYDWKRRMAGVQKSLLPTAGQDAEEGGHFETWAKLLESVEPPLQMKIAEESA